MTHRDTVIKLHVLCQELGEVLLSEVPAALLVADVCKALRLTPKETAFVLGEEATQAVKEWEGARMWEPIEEGHGPVLIEVITSETAGAIAA